MVNHTALTINKTETLNESLTITNCYNRNENSNSTTQRNYPNGPFEWNKKKQGILLSSFFAGYFILQIPAGWLAFKV